MIRLGIIGMGYIGRVHLEAARKVPNAQVVALATSRPVEVRRAYPDVQVYPSHRELLHEPGLDAVCICVPTHLHEQLAIEALDCGQHVLCEKPMALDAAAAARVVEAANRNGRILMIAQVLRFWPQYARIKQLIDSGEIGSVHSVTAYRLSKYPPWSEWFRDPAKSGGCILDLQVHDVDFIHSLLGHPQSVYTQGIQSANKSWDHVHTALAYAGAQATIEASYLMPESWPFSMGILVLGTAGALEYAFRVGANVRERDQASDLFRLYKPDGTASEPTVPAEDGFVTQLRYFVRCLAEGQPPRLCPPQESYDVMRVMTASRQSAETGRVIALAAGEASAAR